MKYNNLEWSDELLDNGRSHTQSEWNDILKGSRWRLPTVKEYESLEGCKNKKFMNALEIDMHKYWLLTSDVLISPFTGKERPVVLGLVDCSRFGIYANDGNGDRPARGVKEIQ